MPNKYTTGRPQAPGGMSEREKMLSGKPYLAVSDPQLVKDRLRARPLIQKYNSYPWPTNEADDPDPDYFGPDDRRQVLAELFGLQLDDVKNKPIEIEPPFFCDYGTNIIFKGPFYSNFNCFVLDCATVTFGSRVMCGPNVQIYAGTHSTDVNERKKGLERAYPVVIGDDVWIGGGAIIIGPCTIGNGTTVAAGAIVRGVVPANVVIGGVPGRILKHLVDRTNHATETPNAITKSIRSGGTKASRPLSNVAHVSLATGENGNERSGPSSRHSEEAVDSTTECFLANIPMGLEASTLQAALSEYGEVRSLSLDRTRRLGFVRFDSVHAVEAAIEAGRSPNGLVISVDKETKDTMVVGIERRRVSDNNRTFNPDLITSTKCLIRRVPNTANFDELKKLIESKAGRIAEWVVQDFTPFDPTKSPTDKFITLQFEQLCSAREAVRLSQSAHGGSGGLDVPGCEGLKVRVEAKRRFVPHQSRTSLRGGHNSYQARYPPRGNHWTSTQTEHIPYKHFTGASSRWRPRRSGAGDTISAQE